MSTADGMQNKENANKDIISTLNKNESTENITQDDEKKIQNPEEKMNTKSCKLIIIFLIVLGIAIIVGVEIGINAIIKKKKPKKK